MNTTMKRDWASVVAGVAMVLIGFAFLLVPGLTLVAIAAVAGVALIASGLLDAISFARFRKELGLSGWMLAAAALDVLLGAVIVIHPLVSAVVIPWVAAIAFAVYGVLEIISAWRMAAARRRGNTGYTRVDEQRVPLWAGFPNYARTAYAQPSVMRGPNGKKADAETPAQPGAASAAPGSATADPASAMPASDPASATPEPGTSPASTRPAEGFLSTIGGSWGWSLFIGLVAIACAVAFFVRPALFAFFLAFFVMMRGIMLIVHGASTGRYATAPAAA